MKRKIVSWNRWEIESFRVGIVCRWPFLEGLHGEVEVGIQVESEDVKLRPILEYEVFSNGQTSWSPIHGHW
jgi:hypothetical protein